MKVYHLEVTPLCLAFTVDAVSEQGSVYVCEALSAEHTACSEQGTSDDRHWNDSAVIVLASLESAGPESVETGELLGQLTFTVLVFPGCFAGPLSDVEHSAHSHLLRLPGRQQRGRR